MIEVMATGATVTDVSDAGWFEFVRAHPAATVFHHPRWAGLLATVYGYRPLVLTVRDSEGSIVAGAPFLEVNSWLTGRRFISLPFTDFCPPLARDEASLAALVSAVKGWRASSGSPRVEIRGGMPDDDGFDLVQVGVRHELRLEPDARRVASRFRSSAVRNVRHAEREGVEVVQLRSREAVEDFYRLHCMTRRRLGVPVQPWRFFAALGQMIIEEPRYGFVMVARRAGRPIAAMVFLSWNRHLIYKYSASDPAHVHLRPNNLLIDHAIEWACGNGFETLDFGKTDTPQAGLRRFKSGWGATELALEYSYAGSNARDQAPGLVNRLSSRIIQVSPPIVGRAIGETLYSHFA
jgi:CelD/BcsL family acetyltransferase involved in cellulose biosynthesis